MLHHELALDSQLTIVPMETKSDHVEVTALFKAVINNDIPKMKELLQQGEKLFPQLKDFPIEGYLNAFLNGTKQETLAETKFLNLCAKFKGKHGFPLIYQCIMQNQLTLLKLLLKNKVNPNITVESKNIHYFFEYYKEDYSLDDCLSDNEWNDITPLHVAALLHNTSMVQELLKAFAQIKTAFITVDDKNEMGPYCFAECHENGLEKLENLFCLLIHAGDIPPIYNDKLYLWDVIDRNHDQLLKMLLDKIILNRMIKLWPSEKERIKRLLDANTKHNPYSAISHDLLYLAALQGRTSMIKTFLAEGADPNLITFDDSNELALFGAIRRNHIDIVKLLIAAKADVNEKSHDKQTPLQFAVFHHFNQIVKLLCDAKADVNLTDHKGMTAVHYAALSNNVEGLAMLKKAGADCLLKDFEQRRIFDFAVLGGHHDLVLKLVNDYGQQPLNLPIKLDQFTQKNAAKQKAIMTHLMAIYDDQDDYNDLPDAACQVDISVADWLNGNKFADSSNVMNNINLVINILRSTCGQDPTGLYQATLEIANTGDKQPNFSKLLDCLLFYLEPKKRNELFDSQESKTMIKNTCTNIEVAQILFAWAEPQRHRALFDLLQTEFKTPNVSFYGQKAYNNDFKLFQQDGLLNRYIMTKLECPYTKVVTSMTMGGIVPYMQTCKNGASYVTKLNGKILPRDMMVNCLKFLLPESKDVSVQKRVTAFEELIKTTPSLPKRSESYKKIFNTLNEIRTCRQKEELDSKVASKINSLDNSLSHHIQQYLQDLKSGKTSIEMKSDSGIDAIKQDIIDEMLSDSKFDDEFSTESAQTKLDEIESSFELSNIFYGAGRRRYFEELFRPTDKSKNQLQTGNSEQRDVKKARSLGSS